MSIIIHLLVSCGSEDVDFSINTSDTTQDTAQAPQTQTLETPLGEDFGQILSPKTRFVGERAGDFSGYALAGGGNLDGDTKAEILIGAYGADPNGIHSGKTYLFMGSSASQLVGDTNLEEADYIFIGEDPKDHSGMRAEFASDLSGDERSDIVIAAPYNKKIYIFHSDSLSLNQQEISLSEADYTLIGENAGDYIGWSISTGDFNGDAQSDLLIGADGSDYGGFSAGITYLILSTSFGDQDRINMELSDYKFIGSYEGENSGQASACGDLDGDGLSDVIIGADGNDNGAENGGAIYIVYADSLFSLDLFLDGADVRIFHDTPFAEAGSALASGSDIDGDGRDDLLVGAPSPEFHSSQQGASYLLLGGGLENGNLSQAFIRFEGNYDNTGYSLSMLSDIDGDGAGEILIGAPMLYSYTHTGRSYLWMSSSLQEGVLSVRNSPYAIKGTAPKSRLGKAVAQAGDIDGDGTTELLIGAPEGGTLKEGVTYLINMIE